MSVGDTFAAKKMGDRGSSINKIPFKVLSGKGYLARGFINRALRSRSSIVQPEYFRYPEVAKSRKIVSKKEDCPSLIFSFRHLNSLLATRKSDKERSRSSWLIILRIGLLALLILNSKRRGLSFRVASTLEPR